MGVKKMPKWMKGFFGLGKVYSTIKEILEWIGKLKGALDEIKDVVREIRELNEEAIEAFKDKKITKKELIGIYDSIGELLKEVEDVCEKLK